jgi:hypothetical protein
MSRPPRWNSAIWSGRLILIVTLPGPPSSYHWWRILCCRLTCIGTGSATRHDAQTSTRLAAREKFIHVWVTGIGRKNKMMS